MKPGTSGSVRIARTVPWLTLAPRGRPPRRGWPAVVALHGYGRDEAGFVVLLRRRFGKVPWVWILPRGPWRVHPERGRAGFAWLVSAHGTPDLEGMEGTERLVRAALTGTAGVDRKRAALLGFSQGGFAAGVAALRRPRSWRGAAVLSAYVNPALVPGGLGRARGARLAFFHGRQDREVPLARARDSARALRDAGLPAEIRSFAGGHALTEPMARSAAAWLGAVLHSP